ncbi:MAG: DEAD/DEAH box helicase family protein [Thermodesulfobacteriota bacterium]|nr:DEAD/DEAH box helicase family protein [Thermodesulfobacteriota bacterium]
MDYKILLEKYNYLLEQVIQLTEENNQLKAQLGLRKSEFIQNTSPAEIAERNINEDESADRKPFLNIDNQSDTFSKIHLFMSLFKGRNDVYAKRWENKNKKTSGYSPVCLNQWQKGLCSKPKIPCSKCGNKFYAALDEGVIENHLRGNILAGIYPMLSDETCCFLVMDFDDADWQKDINVLRDVCMEFNIPFAVERSRSGKGGHVWFFFENPLPAALARRFGTALLTRSMGRRHEIQFKSYDRLFPSQDTMPKGGFGNLIALPLQKAARENQNSEFIDENFQSYGDQWAFLSAIQKIPEGRLDGLISDLSPGHELGSLKPDEEEESEKPWERRRGKIKLEKSDFPNQLNIVKANMLFVPKAGISQRALNRLKRLASFKNPMFYRQQAMRLSTYGHPRVISCADETKDYLCLPRGCELDLSRKLEQLGVDIRIIDKTYRGRRIDVEFNGQLRDEQSMALKYLMHDDTGILSGTTAFGKTILAIKLIAEKKVKTLILVDKVSLLSQWKEKLLQFLVVNEPLPKPSANEKKQRGRKKKIGVIGQLGGGKNILSGIVDIATIQSLSRQGEVKECVINYGMIIADECHHASAFTYEQILKTAHAKYIYGLTATPMRKDGHHPILFMHCGPIRYRDNPKKQAENRPFDHYIVPRFTSFRVPLDRDGDDVSIQELYAELVDNDFRNQQIIQDVLENYKQGRNCLVLSLRTAHVQLLVDNLKEDVQDVFTLIGGMGKKSTREIFQHLADIPADKNIILIATGHFIGEGFDEPRLDTLFLAMPISWKGTLQQYAGRLHRLYKTKKEVRIYDYVDIHVKMLERMYQKRLNGYASMGYKAKGEDIKGAPLDIIFDKDSFLPVFNQDIGAAKKEILIVSPFIRKRRCTQMIDHLKIALGNNIRVTVVTRPLEDFKPKDRPALHRMIDLLKNNSVRVVFKSNIHQKFAVMDQKTVWYGSINLLSYGNALESIMRIESANIANELIKSIESL